jgi:hypothetical protein
MPSNPVSGPPGPLHDCQQSHARSQQHDETHRPNFAGHYFERRDRHDEQMFDRAVLALADQRSASQNDRQHGDLADDLVDGAEPPLIELRIEPRAQGQVHRHRSRASIAIEEFIDFVGHDGLDIASAGKSLRHASRVDIELDARRFASQKVALKVWWNIESECIETGVHAAVHLVLVDEPRYRKVWRIECRDDPGRYRRLIFIDHGNRRVVEGLRLRRRAFWARQLACMPCT